MEKFSLTKPEAMKLIEQKWWLTCTPEQIVEMHIYQDCDRLLCPLDVLYASFRNVFGRPVFTHEFADPESLRREYEGLDPECSFEDVLQKLYNKNPDIKPIFVSKPED